MRQCKDKIAETRKTNTNGGPVKISFEEVNTNMFLIERHHLNRQGKTKNACFSTFHKLNN